MFERYEQLSENIRLERMWWMLLKYGVGLSLLGAVPTVIAFRLWVSELVEVCSGHTPTQRAPVS